MHVLYSAEGTTQGYPLSMLAYAVGILPLIKLLKDPKSQNQLGFADNSSSGGSLANIDKWFQKLLTHGPAYGYFVEPSKCLVVVKERCFEQA